MVRASENVESTPEEYPTAIDSATGGRIEEGSVGGFGSFVLHHLAQRGMLDHGLKVRPMVLPDRFLDHNSPAVQYDEAGLNAKHIVQTALTALGRTMDKAASA